MKVPVLSSLLLAMGFVTQASAIERPKSLDDHSVSTENAPRAAVVEIDASALKEEKALPWLGMFGESPDETLRQHLSLEGGVVVRYVAAQSPADEAGLKAHDIVLEFAGEKISSQQDLRDAVMKHAPGEEVIMSVVSKGETAERTVLLGERPAELNLGRPARVGGPRAKMNLEDYPGLKERLNDLEKIFPQGQDGQKFGGDFQAQMKELEARAQKLGNGQLPGAELKIEDLMDELNNLSLKHRSTVTLMDDQGSVEMKVDDGGKDVTVRDLDGEVIYEGPWNTDQDRAAAPPKVSERIEKLNLDGHANGIRLHFKSDADKRELEEEVPKK